MYTKEIYDDDMKNSQVDEHLEEINCQMENIEFLVHVHVL